MKQDSLQRGKERYRDAADAFRETRAQMLEDLKFSNPAKPEQWPADALSAREGRPCLTFDQTNQYIAQVVNDSRQNKPSIYCLPSDARGSVKVAQALEGLVRNTEYVSRASIAYDTAQEHAARIGLGWLRVVPKVIDDESNQQEPRILRVADPLSVLLDCDSTEPDGSDATDAFVESVMSVKAFKRQWPKAATQSWETSDANSGWFTSETVRVCEHFYAEETETSRIMVKNPDGSMMTLTEDEYWQLAAQIGFKPEVAGNFKSKQRSVKWAKMTGSEVLEETDFPSEYIPVVPVLGYELWIEGKRSLCGMVRRMRDSQQAYNYERSSDIEIKALQPKSPFIGSVRAIEGYENEWAAANTSNQAMLPYNDVDDAGNPLQRPERSQPPMMSQAYAQGGMQAINDLQASIGMYKSNLGAPSNAISGRAKIQDRREGDTANFHYSDNLSRAIEQLGRVVVDMTIRLTDTKRAARILNMDGTNDTIVIDPHQEQPHKMVDGQTSINLTSGKYGVRVKTGPAYSTLREEAAENLTNIVASNPQMMSILGPMWAKMQDWPEADKISRMLMSIAPPEVQAAADDKEIEQQLPPAIKGQMQQMQQTIQQLSQALENAHAEVETKESESAIQAGELKIKQQEADTRQFDAETKRLQLISNVPANPDAIDQTQVVVETIKSESAEKLAIIEATAAVQVAELSKPDPEPNEERDGGIRDMVAAVLESNQQIIQAVTAPRVKKLVRDENGRADYTVETIEG